MGKASLIIGLVLLLVAACFIALTIMSGKVAGVVIVGAIAFMAGWSISTAYRAIP